METMKLEATARTDIGSAKSRRLRVAGTVPAVVYGYRAETKHISVVPKAVIAVLGTRRGTNQLVELQIDGKPGPRCIIREVQVHPVRRTLLHVDFCEVSESRPVTINVPIEIIGRSIAEKAGGKRQQIIRNLNIRCLPQHIPDAITYDVNSIATATTVHISDLIMPEGVTALYRQNYPVVTISMAGGTADAA
ncbi:MAG: 50S ribosomal protein L25 [Myxococcales bacterium]|nr:50S ribosomal protein L25 [Myxococcales bacterium]